MRVRHERRAAPALLQKIERTHLSRHFKFVAVDRIEPPEEYLLNPDHHAQLFAWAKERIGWVKDYIRVPLAATNFAPIEGATIAGWFVNGTIDRQMLRERGIFWSDLDFVYEIDETNH